MSEQNLNSWIAEQKTALSEDYPNILFRGVTLSVVARKDSHIRDAAAFAREELEREVKAGNFDHIEDIEVINEDYKEWLKENKDIAESCHIDYYPANFREFCIKKRHAALFEKFYGLAMYAVNGENVMYHNDRDALEEIIAANAEEIRDLLAEKYPEKFKEGAEAEGKKEEGPGNPTLAPGQNSTLEFTSTATQATP